MFGDIKISPSILSADFMHLADDIATIEAGGAGAVHVDVMDGHFVPNLTMGVPLLKQLKPATSLIMDVHLMISNPLVQVPWFIEAGADILTAHAEALTPEERLTFIDMCHAAGKKAGLSVKPKTPVADIAEVIPLLDLVLIMSVEPGFSGQSYIEGSHLKVAEVAAIAKAAGADPIIEVDGGIGVKTAGAVCSAGADLLVCGNAVFKAEDIAGAIQAVTAAGEAGRSAAE